MEPHGYVFVLFCLPGLLFLRRSSGKELTLRVVGRAALYTTFAIYIAVVGGAAIGATACSLNKWNRIVVVFLFARHAF